jgi:CRISPR-associated endonuclease Csn1
MLRYKLWEECQHTCPYTGREISITQLFSGEVQIEHIFPWSKSLDDSWLNLTLCFADENRLKGERTPYQHFIRSGKATWEDVKKRVITQFYDTKEFPNRYRKFKRFTAEKFDQEGFIARQLNDTRYISKEATNYLSQVAEKVSVAPGNMTAILRGKWGLNTILSDTDAKDRKDHRHHAIDALVMATYKLAHLQELQKWNKYNRSAELRNFPMPWDSFRQDAELSILSILVSHKADRKVLTKRKFRIKKGKVEFQNTGISARGQLHMDTVYGKRKAPGQTEAYHVRKSLKGLSEAAFSKIVDPRVRALVYDRLRQRGIPIDQKSGKPKPETKEQKEAFKAAFDIPVLLPNKNGDPVPVHKVRISENLGNAANQNAGINRYVNPRNNHHVLIYKNDQGVVDENVVTFWEAVERKRQRVPVFNPPVNCQEPIYYFTSNASFIVGLSKNEFELNRNNFALLSKYTYRIQKFSSKDYFFRLSSESTIERDDAPYLHRISLKALKAAKIAPVRINAIGEIIGNTVFFQLADS